METCQHTLTTCLCTSRPESPSDDLFLFHEKSDTALKPGSPLEGYHTQVLQGAFLTSAEDFHSYQKNRTKFVVLPKMLQQVSINGLPFLLKSDILFMECLLRNRGFR